MSGDDVSALTGFPLVSPRGGPVPGGSFEPVVAVLLFSCTLALHARQVDIKLHVNSSLSFK